jgi:hypothetical protein
LQTALQAVRECFDVHPVIAPAAVDGDSWIRFRVCFGPQGFDIGLIDPLDICGYGRYSLVGVRLMRCRAGVYFARADQADGKTVLLGYTVKLSKLFSMLF